MIVLGLSGGMAMWRLLVGPLTVSPDGMRYLAMGAGIPVSMPFRLRWLAPAVCRDSIARWRCWTAVHVAALPALTAMWLSHWVDDPLRCALGGLLVVGLPGLWQINLRWGVLVDGSSMAWALASAIALQHEQPLLACALAVVCGCIKETGPVFAACFAWSPLPLAGLIVPVVLRLTARRTSDLLGDDDLLDKPLVAGLVAHYRRWLDPLFMVTPWGVCMAGVLVGDAAVLPMLVITLTIAYGQLLVATDTVRLYQWGAPPLILGTVLVLPTWALGVALVPHLVNPWAGRGI
ncbi:hypothetical protein [Microtetraspora glauca]|uniref:Uncharacterized protein n=1 Tax=Microtetraspora glauca TaxID=1996 RepID=A0ABV3GSI0_MICGL